MPSYKCLDDARWWQENLAPWVEFVAMDRWTECVALFESEPKADDGGMWGPQGILRHSAMIGLIWTDLPEDWRTSLRRRPKVWRVPDENTPIDAKVWARQRGQNRWYPLYWAGKERCFQDGATSWSSPRGRAWLWDWIVLADPDDPNTPPPDDWCPEAPRCPETPK